MRTQYFKVYPDPKNKKYFYRVCVFKNEKALKRDYEKKCGPMNGSGGLGGYCSRHKVLNFKKGSKRATVSGYLGDIGLDATYITAEVVSHECAHAAIGYMRRLKRHKTMMGRESVKGKVGACEEEFCYALGRMAQQISNWYNSWTHSQKK